MTKRKKIIVYSILFATGAFLSWAFIWPLVSKEQQVPEELTRGKYGELMSADVVSRFCNKERFLRLNQCFDFPLDNCQQLMKMKANTCIQGHLNELPELITQKEALIAKRWQIKVGQCVGKEAMLELAQNQDTETKSCMETVIGKLK